MTLREHEHPEARIPGGCLGGWLPYTAVCFLRLKCHVTQKDNLAFSEVSWFLTGNLVIHSTTGWTRSVRVLAVGRWGGVTHINVNRGRGEWVLWWRGRYLVVWERVILGMWPLVREVSHQRLSWERVTWTEKSEARARVNSGRGKRRAFQWQWWGRGFRSLSF